jgi:hypothetical protein
VCGRGRRGAARGRWRERAREEGDRGGALADLGPDIAAAAHIIIIIKEVAQPADDPREGERESGMRERERRRRRPTALTWEERGG